MIAAADEAAPTVPLTGFQLPAGLTAPTSACT